MMTTLAELTPGQKAYRPFGAAEELLYDRSDEVIMDGPAGTGKSRGCLEKLHLCAEKYSGMRGLIIRKTRHSCTDSALVTFEEKVIPVGHPCLGGAQRAQRHSYRYPNGSEIVVGGMDKPTKIMSTEFDMIYVQEMLELAESDIEALSTRLRNGVMPYQQIIGDTNPDGPTHWIVQRAKRGTMKMLHSYHEDNPVLFDQRTGQMTPFGTTYLEKLDNLTGVRKDRLRYGKWVAAEGLVYEGFDAKIHLINRNDARYGLQKGVPYAWPRLWTFDFGFVNPFVWQCWAIDPDGRMLREWEIYRSHVLVEDLGREIKAFTSDKPRPTAIICDHDAEDRATLERHLGMPTKPAYKAVSAGIQAVAARLKPEADGKPRLLFLRDSQVGEPDDLLIDKKLPTSTEDEFNGYVWDTSNGRKRGEDPLKANDHGVDDTRYAVAYQDQIQVGNRRTLEWY